MNRKHLIIFAVGGLFVWELAIATTFLSVRYYTHSRPVLRAGVIDTDSLIHRLDLSQEQKAKLDPMETSLKKDLDGIQVDLAQERMALCELMGNDAKDPQKLDAYVNRVAALEAQQQRRVVEHLMDMRTVLNPTQKKKLFSSLMQAICKGCREMVPNQKCLCGMCDTKKG